MHAMAPPLVKFLLPSALGVLFFLTPIQVDGKTTILVGALASALGEFLGAMLPTLVVGLFVLSATFGVALTIANPHAASSLTRQLFVTTWGWLFLRCVGAVFAIFTFLQMGPEWIGGEATGQVALEIGGLILCIMLLANYLLPLLAEFGFLEFIGVLLVRPFRFLFGLPGRAGLDAVTSWVGDSSVGALLTIRQYEEGAYTAREAAVVVTNFSAVSLPFTVVVTEIAKLEVGFLQFYSVVILIGVVAALITPRLPPLKGIANKYRVELDTHGQEKGDCEGASERVEEVHSGKDVGLFSAAFAAALRRAQNAPSVREILSRGTKSCLDIFIAVLPAAMAIEFIALVIHEYSSIFAWISYPLLPLLHLFAVAAPEQVLPGLLVGFLDQFVPAIIAQDIGAAQARFVLAGLSVTQLIFIAENGALVLRSSIPLNLGQLFVIFLWRTLIALPLLSLAAFLLH